jgi:glucosamine kinase
MKIIADSGSTKTQWLFIKNGVEVGRFKTIGLNPYFVDSETTKSVLDSGLKEIGIDKNEITEIHFYGAGCSISEKKEIIHQGLHEVSNKVKIFVESDLLGAARALFGQDKGLACILGTGSNAAIYDGNDFTDKTISLGYILGDEGSGNNIGKQLVTQYIRKEMPNDLCIKFEMYHKLEISTIIHKLYKEEFPNRFLASFALFAAENQNHPHIQKIIFSSFHQFILKQVSALPNWNQYTIGFVGSIAFHFQDILTNVLMEFNIQKGKILENPIDELGRFHTNK